MLFRILADLIVFMHLAFIAFAILGGLLAFRWRWVPWFHVPAVAWGVAVEFSGWFCPLTPLENWFRSSGGAAGYSGGFVERYLVPVVYPGELTREFQMLIGSALAAMNLAVYFSV